MKPIKPWALAAAWLLGFAAGGGQLPGISNISLPNIGWVIGSSAPYVCPMDMPVSVSYAIDGSNTGVESLGKTNPGVIAKIQLTAGAGNFREVDVTTSKTEPNELPWVKSAWNALDKQHPPQWVASGPRGGWKSKALPTNAADAEKALKAIMK